ncbi:hypothetical protein P691DRAFT_664712 [Macrolepiota fuliginosa MF-IS2]|uniref:Zinc finger Mcm10/DnaG-type domain-containing protein n=1 Tax=Macrolepiota fuliginosa MF-IS2 TaxID=1400762 RepID=A0A9P5XGW7_9AGAR|nr:hypothetical protein P691DRAFT_664712 [Macrolepiota fuliginosa MF-IS2]
MESSTSRTNTAQTKQEELKAQIIALQAQLAAIPDDQNCLVKAANSPKRKKPEPAILAPATPSPKKKRRIEGKNDKQLKPRNSQPSFQKLPRASTSGGAVSSNTSSVQGAESNPAPSQFLSKLVEVKSRPNQVSVPEAIARTSAFSDTTRPNRPEENPEGPTEFSLKRDDRLALVEDLERGPYDFTPPSGDPNFQQLEPHSGIRLSSRTLSHEDFREYMSFRYYLSPSRLYSIIRLRPDKQGYDVPLFGDWVTVAVIAERGPVKLTRAPVTLGPDEQQGKKPWQKEKGKDKEDEAKKPTGKKYVNFKLVDFGARSRSSADGGQCVVRGDAFLTLLLFEADGFDLIQEGGQKPRKLYKGGSRGAFEKMAKVKEGDVVALLNPKILKPFQRSQDTPHPVNNILALTPESSDSIVVIGRSRDLGMCGVVKRDGKACGSWCDKRVSDVCEYHLQNAVQHRRAGRAEFSVGTSGMSATSVHKRKAEYDPARQWGLKPEEATRGSTYVISGHVVSGSNADPRNMYVGETMGREGQAKAQRKSVGDADRALKALLERDHNGMKAVLLAREASGISNSGKSENKSAFLSDDEPPRSGKNAFTAEVVKQLGFDPTRKTGRSKKPDNSVIQSKLDALKDARQARKEVTLGPRPGPKIRSGVVVPISALKDHKPSSQASKVEAIEGDGNETMIDLDDY